MKKLYRNKKWILRIAAVLIVLHISLPFALVAYVNNVLKDIPGYTGSVEWIHVNLFRGAYQIHGLDIKLESEGTVEPFFSSEAIDISLEWKALLNGEIVGEIVLVKPKVVFTPTAESSSPSGEESGENVDWTKPIKELVPLTVNRFEIVEGQVHYKDTSSSPKVDVFSERINALATNLGNATASNKELPSYLKLSATSIGNGKLNIEGGLNILLPLPSFDIDVSFEQIDLPDLNTFFEAYLNTSLSKGTLDFYSEFSGVDGELKGYVKPLLKDMKFGNWEEDRNKPIKLIWSSILELTTEIFENQKKSQFATKVPLEGRYDDVNTNIFKTLGGILNNAFIKAIKEKTDDSIDIEDLEE